MRYRLPALFLPVILAGVFLGFQPTVWAAPEVAFTISMPQPSTHYLDVEMRVNGIPGKTVDLVMPVWTPGSYLEREYARNVQEMRVADADDKPLPFRKMTKNTWRVEKGTTTAIVARYRVYANALTVQQAEVNTTHAFWNNAAVLMHIGGGVALPATVTIQAPKDWRIATPLDAVPGSSNTFRAPNFDILYDSPVEVGTFNELTFEAKGKPHRIIITGKGNYTPETLTTDLKRIVEAAAGMMGDLPYNNYTFFVTLKPGGGGGLEHLSSTALLYPPYGFKPPSNYTDFLSLAAHEYFHLWNVKRIRPDALGPFDYSHENYTRSLWVAEGITSYYEYLLLRRANLIDAPGLLQSYTSSIAQIEQTPGRKVQSLEDASFDAWIKYYRRDENAVNSQMSYYTKGAVVGLLLDLTIRQRTNGSKSLDDVFRTLYQDFALKSKNYTPLDFQRVCESVTGSSLENFFNDNVRGTRELDYDIAFATVGLRLKRDNGTPAEPYIGGRLTEESGAVRVSLVPAETPAYEQGLVVGDVIAAIDGLRVTGLTFFNERLREKKPGDTVTLTLFRNDVLTTVDFKLGGQVRPDFRLVPVENPNADQKRQYKAWTGVDLK